MPTTASSPRASWRWIAALITATALVLGMGPSPAAADPGALTPALARTAAKAPDREVSVIAQLTRGVGTDYGAARVRAHGGVVVRPVALINAVAARLTASRAAALAAEPGFRAVSIDARVAGTGMRLEPSKLATAYNQSIRADRAWAAGHSGQGVGVAVIDTSVAGDHADFRGASGASRVKVSAIVNPSATNGRDTVGHGTHIAGLIAGDGARRPGADPLRGRYVGVAPGADLISIKADDGQGATSLLDVIEGLQFAVDHKDAYGIRIVNLSLRSTIAESYLTDPLDAAAEAAVNAGLVVVAAAGNLGTAEDAVNYAPANDPWVLTVGAVDDRGTRTTDDDTLVPWSSRGTTQDGVPKPDVLAPGARLIAPLAPNSKYAELCPQCVVDGQYLRLGGTSMAAAVGSGSVATLLSARPELTPMQVKGTLIDRARTLTDGGNEIALDKAINTQPTTYRPGRPANELLDPATGRIDYNRVSWSRVSWSEAVDPLRVSWSRVSWSRVSWSRVSWSATQASCADLERVSWSRVSWSAEENASAKDECAAAGHAGADASAATDPQRVSWSRVSWSRVSWATSFDK